MFNVPSMKNGGNRLTPQTRTMRANATQEANERQGTVPGYAAALLFGLSAYAVAIASGAL